MNVRDLNHTVRHICHIVYVFSKLLKYFHDYCLFNMSGQLVVGNIFCCFWLKNYKNNIFLRYSMTTKQHFLRQRVTQITKNGLNAQERSLHDCKIPQHIFESWWINCVLRLSLGLSTLIMEFEDKQAYKIFETGVLVWKSKKMESCQPIFNNGNNMLTAKWWTHVSNCFF